MGKNHTCPPMLYRMFDKDNNLLYVGMSASLLSRVRTHSSNSIWFHEVRKITCEPFYDSVEAFAAERAAIKSEQPIHNKQLRYKPVPRFIDLENNGWVKVSAWKWTHPMYAKKVKRYAEACHFMDTKQRKLEGKKPLY